MLSVSTMTMMTGGNGATVMAVLLCASLLGFLWHNRPPARIYLGDAGSLTIGFLIGALSIETALKGATGFLLAAPLVLMAVPFFDTLMAIVRRKLRGLGIGQADREHIHHCLQEQGLTRGQSLLVLAGISLLMAGTALAATYYKNDLIAVSACLLVPAALIAGRVFGHTETMLFARKLKGIGWMLLDAAGLGRRQEPTVAQDDAPDNEEPIKIPFEPNAPLAGVDPPGEQTKRVA
jgi:UDP-GlcNAc:undecaprenyl-phosphate GlcNAc-1-phosphate transferase